MPCAAAANAPTTGSTLRAAGMFEGGSDGGGPSSRAATSAAANCDAEAGSPPAFTLVPVQR